MSNEDKSAKAPDPPIKAEVDLRDFRFMPLDVRRLRDSAIAVKATPAAFRAAVFLWCAAWHQVPASSLPNDEEELAHLAGLGRDLKTWRRVSEYALHGFKLCSDGRLYHPLISNEAKRAWARKRSGKRAAEARWHPEKRRRRRSTKATKNSSLQCNEQIEELFEPEKNKQDQKLNATAMRTQCLDRDRDRDKKEKQAKERDPIASSRALPGWLDRSLWNEFRKHRSRMRKPMTDYAEKRAIMKLEALREQGNDPRDVINQSIDSGWQGLFELKRNTDGTAKNNEGLRDAVRRRREERGEG